MIFPQQLFFETLIIRFTYTLHIEYARLDKSKLILQFCEEKISKNHSSKWLLLYWFLFRKKKIIVIIDLES